MGQSEAGGSGVQSRPKYRTILSTAKDYKLWIERWLLNYKNMNKIYLLLIGLLFVSCSKEGLLDSTDLDELTDEKVFSDVENTRKALYNLYGSMRQVSNKNSGSFSPLFDMNVTVAMLDNATDDGAGNTTRTAGI